MDVGSIQKHGKFSPRKRARMTDYREKGKDFPSKQGDELSFTGTGEDLMMEIMHE